MRSTFINKLTALAAQDERIFLLTGDLGYMALEPFAQSFPRRFINAGVAEQNMVGIATGLAEAGYIPFVYSIVTFASMRAYEFIRNGPILHRLPVRVVGVGGGMEYSHNGLSHYGLEDVSLMRTQPAMTVISPADAAQAASALEKTYQLNGPIYYRLGKDDSTKIDGLNGSFDFDRVQIVQEGKDLLIITSGAAAAQAVAAALDLAREGVSARVLIAPVLNPPPIKDLEEHMRQFPAVLTVECHYLNGGLGSLAAEIIAEGGFHCRLLRCGIREMPAGVSGSQPYLHDRFGLSPAALADSARSLMSTVCAALR